GVVEPPLSPGEEAAVLLADARHMIGRQARDGGLAPGGEGALRQLARQGGRMRGGRGAGRGAGAGGGFLTPGADHCYRSGGEGWGPARVRVFGPAGAALELRVSNDHGTVRGAKAGPSPGVDWSPPLPAGEMVTVRLANRGARGAVYRLVGN